jgi:hypothetical protein
MRDPPDRRHGLLVRTKINRAWFRCGYGNVKIVDYWVRVRVGDPPPPAVPPTGGEPRWVRATRRTAAVTPPGSADPVVASESEARETWLVDSFELVVPRYPWQKGRETGS